ncbi:hypothetical protein DH2020_044320 [Rehmannia glutinosa]|uniref:TF-B3 domain-containing protein n=1 Tax=Rehmannia glutinosa TaxID=99300 RepID=A0ABR0UHH2_REHGL
MADFGNSYIRFEYSIVLCQKGNFTWASALGPLCIGQEYPFPCEDMWHLDVMQAYILSLDTLDIIMMMHDIDYLGRKRLRKTGVARMSMVESRRRWEVGEWACSRRNPFHLYEVFKCVRLDLGNYHFWKAQVLSTLRAHGFDGYLFGTIRPPPEFHPISGTSNSELLRVPRLTFALFQIPISLESALMSDVLKIDIEKSTRNGLIIREVKPDVSIDDLSNLTNGIENLWFLFIPMDFIKDFNIDFTEEITLVDPRRRAFRAKCKKWKDGRMIVTGGWRRLCRLNLVTKDDRCICEFIQEEDRRLYLNVSVDLSLYELAIIVIFATKFNAKSSPSSGDYHPSALPFLALRMKLPPSGSTNVISSVKSKLKSLIKSMGINYHDNEINLYITPGLVWRYHLRHRGLPKGSRFEEVEPLVVKNAYGESEVVELALAQGEQKANQNPKLVRIDGLVWFGLNGVSRNHKNPVEFQSTGAETVPVPSPDFVAPDTIST